MTRRRAALAAALVVVLAAAAAAYLLLFRGTPRELVELARQGDEKQLRDPMRAPRGGERVLLIALDGIGDEALRQAVASGAMRRVAALLGESRGPDLYAHGYAVPGALSVLPSTTMAAWTSLFTGEPAGRTGVPGNEWFAREEVRFYAPVPVSVSGMEHLARVYTDQLMDSVVAVPTLFERAGVRSYVSVGGVHRGADLLTLPDPAQYVDLMEGWVRGLSDDDEPAEAGAYAALDSTSVASLAASIEAHGLADLQVVYLPGADLYTHVAADPLADQQRYLAEVVDPAVARLLDLYDARGALDETWVVFVSDHGHTPVVDDERHALGDGPGGPTDVLERIGFRMRPPELETDADDFQGVVAYQGGMAYVYLADRSTCPEPGDRCDWNRPPRLSEDVLPVADAFFRASREGAVAPQMAGSLEMVLARSPQPVGREALPFQVWTGARLEPLGEHLRRLPRPELLELERRLEGLATGPHGHRAGDVLLMARTGAHLPLAERFYFSGRYHSWHGSPTAADSRIPIVVARRGADGAAVQARVRAAAGEAPSQLDIVRLVLGLLGVDGEGG
jgi:hypothetical protein